MVRSEMPKTKKRILLLIGAAHTPRWDKKCQAIAEYLDSSRYEVAISSLLDLVYFTSIGECAVYDPQAGWDIADFDLVVFRAINEQEDLAVAAAAYLRQRGVRYIDARIPQRGKHKLECAFVRVEHGLPVPPTLYTRAALLPEAFSRAGLAFPAVVKASNGRKGRDNYKVDSMVQLQKIVSEGEHKFVVQPLIPNEGDYRVLVYNGRIEFAFLRTAAPGTHLNNTSRGGAAYIIDAQRKFSKQMQADIVRAAAVDRLQIAGVDVLCDAHTGQHYILEVNSSPQLSDGVFAEAHMRPYSALLASLAEGQEIVYEN